MFMNLKQLALPCSQMCFKQLTEAYCKEIEAQSLVSTLSQPIPLYRARIEFELPKGALENKKIPPVALNAMKLLVEVLDKIINSDEYIKKECIEKNNKKNNEEKAKTTLESNDPGSTPVDENVTTTLESNDPGSTPADENVTTTHESDDPSRHSADARWQVRCQILRLLRENKMTKQEIADVVGRHRNTVSKIATRLRKNPDLKNEDLREDHHGNYENPFHKIPLEVYLVLRVILITTLPIHFGFSYSSWTGPAIHQLLTEFCHLDIKLSYVYYFLKKTNITSKFAERINPSQDPIKVDEFVNIEFRKIVARALLTRSTILFFDEVHAFSGNHQRGFAPVGESAIMSHTTAGMHSSKSFLVFMGLDGFIRIFEIDGSFTAEDFKNILRQLKKENPGKKFTLIGDNARVHHAKVVQRWLKHHNGGKMCFDMHFLPAYSPDLNPAERWNNIFKSHLRGTFCKNEKQIEEVSRAFIEPYNNNEKGDQVKKLFEDKKCNYTIKEFEKGKKIAERYRRLFKISN